MFLETISRQFRLAMPRNVKVLRTRLLPAGEEEGVSGGRGAGGVQDEGEGGETGKRSL